MAAIEISYSIPDYDFVLFWLGNIIILEFNGWDMQWDQLNIVNYIQKAKEDYLY